MEFYPAPFTGDEVRGWIDWNLRNYDEHGYGLWALVLKESGEVLGDCGLTWQRVGYSPSPELEIGWHTRRDHWNKGLATEAALAVRQSESGDTSATSGKPISTNDFRSWYSLHSQTLTRCRSPHVNDNGYAFCLIFLPRK